MNCPRDGQAIEEKSLGAATLPVCGKCTGMFLHQGELNKIAAPTAGDLEFSTVDLDTFQHEDAYGPIPCPDCGADEMAKVEFNIHTNIILDYCRACGGFWLDGTEMERIQDEVRRLNEAAAEDSHEPAMLWFARFIWSLPH
jgi:Zn-finger nucleic acid-binding protein